ncbi:MAG: AraC family transcriptional regulator [Rikenellaceae bacterium]
MKVKRHVLDSVEQFDKIELSDDTFSTPTMILGGGLMLCRQGGCNISINAKSYAVHKWDLIVVSPYSIIKMESITHDFDCIVMGAGIELFTQVKLPDKGKYFVDITAHPSITLTPKEAEDILLLRAQLQREEANSDQPFYDDIHTSILRIIILKIFALYSNRKPNQEISLSRNHEILNAFILDLLKYSHRERKLEFYAQHQSLTASYLSRCVKSMTGKSASEMLIEIVVNSIKSRLLESNKRISEIAEEFNFCSNSTFSQYFKKYTSLSPKEFRDSFIP